MLQKACQITAALYLLVLVLASSARAFQSGGQASLSFVPDTASVSPGRDFKVDIVLTASTEPITGVAIRAAYDAVSPGDLNVVSILPNANLGWMFPVQSSVVNDGQVIIDIVGLTTEPAGFTVNGEAKIATLTLRSTAAFTAKQIAFDTSQTQVLRKADAIDILGKVAGVSLMAGAQAGTVTVTPPPPVMVENVVGDEDITAVPVAETTPSVEAEPTEVMEEEEETVAMAEAPTTAAPALPSRNRLIAAALILGVGVSILVLVGYLYRRSGRAAKGREMGPPIPADIPPVIPPPAPPSSQPPIQE